MINAAAYALGANRSCIRDLFEYGLQRAKVVGPENVFDYSLGNPSIPSPPQVNQAILEVLQEESSLAVHGYTPAAGDYGARQAIAGELSRRYGVTVKPEELFLGCGAAPELVSVMQALAVHGAELLVIAPYFPEYRPWAEQAGLTLKVVPADIPGFQIDLEAVEALLTEHTQALLINSPNNPAGTVYTEKTLQSLAALLRRKSEDYGHPIYLICDEPYRELVYGDAVVPFVPAIYRDAVVCYSYSKSLSLPGERIGYVYLPETATDSDLLYAAIAGAARANGHVCAPSLWQKVIARCVDLRPDLEAYDKNRRTLYDALTGYGYEIARPDGAFYLFVRAPGGDSQAFSEKAKAKDLLLVPGDDFGCREYFRICYCVDHDKILRSLPLFRELIQE